MTLFCDRTARSAVGLRTAGRVDHAGEEHRAQQTSRCPAGNASQALNRQAASQIRQHGVRTP